MAKPNGIDAIETRIAAARELVVGQYLEVSHELDGDDAPTGDDRTFRLFDRTYLQGLADMVVHLESGGSIASLAQTIAREMRGYRTGVIETGVLHIHPVGLDLSQVSEGKLPDEEGVRGIMGKYLSPEVMRQVLSPIDPARGNVLPPQTPTVDHLRRIDPLGR